MKIKEVRELETKDLVERLEAEIAKYDQMKLNHAITKWIKPLLLQLSSRRCTRYMVSLFRRQRNTMHMMKIMRLM